MYYENCPKKGDLTDCNNYHGISLINVGLKILSKIVTNRMSNYAKNLMVSSDLNNLDLETKEECISLFISNLGNLSRKKVYKEKFKYLAFSWFRKKKSYDSVPIF